MKRQQVNIELKDMKTPKNKIELKDMKTPKRLYWAERHQKSQVCIELQNNINVLFLINNTIWSQTFDVKHWINTIKTSLCWSGL